MKTPIFDFVKKYNEKKSVRLHMPGHKGKSFLGIEGIDITEIDGADVLYSAHGIIEESQKNASALFNTQKTLYSCEGSSLSIRAMLYLALLTNKTHSKTVLAARNAHKVFMSAAALLGFDIEWLCTDSNSIITCNISEQELDAKLSEMSEKPVAVYVTSPDYLGNILDIKGLSRACRKHGVLLLCDNAHGAYLNFLQDSMHPIALGAHMCCDSAHKTLPVLTGGGYLHISKDAPLALSENAARAMAMFASTSPSYLIMQSLDLANSYLSEGFIDKLESCAKRIADVKNTLLKRGFKLIGNEPLKITVAPKSFGYTGIELSRYLLKNNIVCEFADPDFVVFMFTPETDAKETEALAELLCALLRRDEVTEAPPVFVKPIRAMSARQAAFSMSRVIPVSEAKNRILACENVSCPPAIPVAVCGEVIDENTIKIFEYYGIKEISVVDDAEI